MKRKSHRKLCASAVAVSRRQRQLHSAIFDECSRVSDGACVAPNRAVAREIERDELLDVYGGIGRPLGMEGYLAVPTYTALGMMRPAVRMMEAASPQFVKNWAAAARQSSDWVVKNVYGGHDQARLMYDEFHRAMFGH